MCPRVGADHVSPDRHPRVRAAHHYVLRPALLIAGDTAHCGAHLEVSTIAETSRGFAKVRFQLYSRTHDTAAPVLTLPVWQLSVVTTRVPDTLYTTQLW